MRLAAEIDSTQSYDVFLPDARLAAAVMSNLTLPNSLRGFGKHLLGACQMILR